MTSGIFITGTDTGVGKTRFTVALMEALKKQGHKTAGMKPVACGAVFNNGKLMNDDANLIMQYCSEQTNYELINPVVFESPVAPNIAANQKNETISLKQIVSSYKQLASSYGYVVVEGIGGWRVPISDKLSTVDLVRELSLPVVMVVGMRLGCINHAILTAEAIRADGVNLCGWVSNHLENDRPLTFKRDILATLKERLACPHIADVPYAEDFEPGNMLKSIDLSFISVS
jgi:dethiobiotin synthetase